jgi:hypothetical protein
MMNEVRYRAGSVVPSVAIAAIAGAACIAVVLVAVAALLLLTAVDTGRLDFARRSVSTTAIVAAVFPVFVLLSIAVPALHVVAMPRVLVPFCRRGHEKGKPRTKAITKAGIPVLTMANRFTPPPPSQSVTVSPRNWTRG